MKKIGLVIFGTALLAGCASGGGGTTVATPSTQVVPTAVTPATPIDARIKFDPIVQKETIPVYGDVTKTYSVGEYKASSNFPSTEKYKIADYAFFTASVKGTHTGFNADPNEPIRAGTWEPTYQIMEADINGDGHKDFFAVEYIQGARDSSPKSNLLAFINDGNGHFKLSPDAFTAKQFPCIGGGNQLNSTTPNSECGFYKSLIRHPVVDDLDGDGKADFFWPTLLYLSKGGALQNASNTLPDFFKQPHIGPVFVHDLASGDVDGNKGTDIFIPLFGTTKAGFKLDGSKDPCGICNQPLPWVMLMNDGKGNFTMNTNFPTMPILPSNQSINLWAATATIADFDGDGKGDVAVGWANPANAEKFGYVKNSAGMVYYNDGKNDWRVRKPTELPANWYGANGKANSMVAMDFDGDGKIDIVLASTKVDPYYIGRMVQFFKNVNGTSFVDVTTTVNPNTKYENGNGTPWFNGEGPLKVVDFNKDGKLDIVDSNYNTYVLINEGGKFKLVDNFPTVGGGKDGKSRGALYPVEIDGKYDYDFVSYRFDENGDTGTTTLYQVLDPPSPYELMLADLFNKVNKYGELASTATTAFSDLFYYGRNNNFDARGFTSYRNGIKQYGAVFKPGAIGFGFMSTDSDSPTVKGKTDSVGLFTYHDNFRTGLAYAHSNLTAITNSQYFGSSSSNTTADTVGLEVTYGNSFGDFNYRVGPRYAFTRVNGFKERNVGINGEYLADIPLTVAKQNFQAGTWVTNVDYTRYLRRGDNLFYAGVDVEYLYHFYSTKHKISFSTGGPYIQTVAASTLDKSENYVSLYVGTLYKNSITTAFAVTNITKKNPTYTVTFGARF